MGCIIKYKDQSIPEEQFLQYLNKQIAINQLFESDSNFANQVYEALGFTNELLSFDNIIETDNKEEKKEKLNKRREIVLKEINAIEELIRTNPDEITIYYTALYENDYQQTKYFDKTNWEQSTEKYKTSKVISKPSYLHSHLDEELQKRIKNLQVINSSLYYNIEEINYSNIFQIGKNYSSLEILKYISNNKKDVLSSIAEKLLKYSEKNNVEVSILEKGEKSNVAGSYSSIKNKIEIYGKKSITSHTLIHEIVHSLSVIDINLNPDSKQVKSLKNILKNILDKKILKEYENFESSYEDYATKNIKELLSEIISRPDILSHLALYDTNYDLITSKYKKETLLDEIIKIISDIFNFTKRESETLADAILLNAVEIFENSRTTSNYQSTEITPQQKQQALQLYSQYLESLNKPNTNPILQGNQQEQVKKFAELQERLNNKEFLEGAKNAFESSEELQNVYYEALGYKTKSEIGVSIGKDLLSIEENEIPKKEGESFSEMQVRVKQNINIRKRIEVANKNNIKQGKLYSFSELESLLDSSIFDDDIYSGLRSILSQITFRFGSLNKVNKKTNGYYDSINNTINLEILHLTNSDFKRTLLHEIIHAATFINLGEDAILTDIQKTALNNLNNLIEELKKDRDFFGEYGLTNANELLAELANKNFVNKLKKKTFSNNQSFFEKIISEIVKLLGLNTTAYDIVKESFDSLVKEYKSINQITPQQKQNALNAYTNYLARVSLGIIKNPSSGGYNYESQVKDIVYHGTDTRFESFDKNKISSKESTAHAKGFYFGWAGKFGAAASYAGNFGRGKEKVLLANTVQIQNPFILNGSFAPIKENQQFVDFLIRNGFDITKWKHYPKGDIFDYTTSVGTDKITEALKREGYDSIIVNKGGWKTIKRNVELGDVQANSDELIVFEPEQIHILSSKQDIEGFKNFLSQTTIEPIKEENITQEDIDKLPPCVT